MAEVEPLLRSRLGGRLEVHTAHQSLADLPAGHARDPGRTRPYGTTHAVLAARHLLVGSFAVLNADDCYGRDAITVAARFLQTAGPGARHHAVVGFRLADAVGPSGGVNRAELVTAADGALLRATEIRDITRTASGDFQGRVGTEARRLRADTLVSMNLWAFSPEILRPLAGAFGRFLDQGPAENAECTLPDSVQEAISRGEATVEVLPTTSRWCGVTHPGDREWVALELQQAVLRGEYPERLWA
jgi:hypothetical protein